MVIKVSNSVKSFFNSHLIPIYKIASIIPTEQGWELEVEVIEEKEYMESHAKDEMIGVYKVIVNKDAEVVSFTRIQLRSRSAIN